MKEQIYKLFAESVIVQSLLTIGIWSVICYMYIMQYDIPDVLISVGLTLIGFWFGSKIKYAKGM